jgi:iron uptake system component EfeO
MRTDMPAPVLAPLSVAAAVAVAVALAGCGGGSDGTSASSGSSAGGPIPVKAGESSCEVQRTSLPAGTHTFAVTNTGTQVTEFYVYAPGDRIMGEVENIGPALTRNLTVELPAGQYQTACKPGQVGQGIRGALTVSGSAPALSEDAALAQAVTSYRAYVQRQSTALLERTGEFVAAVKARDAAKAKHLFPRARVHYERIEPVAEAFGDLDPLIDQRENDVEAGKPFTGFHRLEKDLWVGGDLSTSGPVADQLLRDVTTLTQRIPTLKLTPLDLANGAKELLDEVATSKVTGEEDRYSHTDLWDFDANVEGAKTAIASLRPALQQRDAELLKLLDTRFADVERGLAEFARDDGFVPYTELTKAQVRALADRVNALAEPLSRVAAAVAGK